MNLGSVKKPILVVIPILVLVMVVVVVVLVRGGKVSAPRLFSKGPKVELKTTYKNPFDKNTQYVNPFDKYKNPFVTNR